MAVAGVLGAAGVALAAASAHLGGGDLARLASFFLLIHAAAIPGVLAIPLGWPWSRCAVGGVMALGTALFSGDLGVLAFTRHTPVPGLAPTGGLLLIAAWLGLSVFALVGPRR